MKAIVWIHKKWIMPLQFSKISSASLLKACTKMWVYRTNDVGACIAVWKPMSTGEDDVEILLPTANTARLKRVAAFIPTKKSAQFFHPSSSKILLNFFSGTTTQTQYFENTHIFLINIGCLSPSSEPNAVWITNRREHKILLTAVSTYKTQVYTKRHSSWSWD